MSDLLRTDDLILHLRRGSPLDLDLERVRLPRFTEIREAEQTEFGGSGREPIVIARSRTATWAVMPLARKSSFDVKDAEAFLKVVASVQKKHPEKPVKGIVLTRGPIANDSKKKLAACGHVASSVAG